MATPPIVQAFLAELESSLHRTPPARAVRLQFHIDGHACGVAATDKGEVDIRNGTIDNADATVSFSGEVLEKLGSGKMSLPMAVMSNKIAVKGNRKALTHLAPQLRPAFERFTLRAKTAQSANQVPTDSNDKNAQSTLALLNGTPMNDKTWYLAKAWVPDDTRRACVGCGSEFTVFRRRHHCRACGDVFCGNCTSYEYDGHRMCGPCSRRIMNAELNRATVDSETHDINPASAAKAQALNGEDSKWNTGAAGQDFSRTSTNTMSSWQSTVEEVTDELDNEIDAEVTGVLERQVLKQLLKQQKEPVPAGVKPKQSMGATAESDAADDDAADSAASSGTAATCVSTFVTILATAAVAIPLTLLAIRLTDRGSRPSSGEGSGDHHDLFQLLQADLAVVATHASAWLTTGYQYVADSWWATAVFAFSVISVFFRLMRNVLFIRALRVYYCAFIVIVEIKLMQQWCKYRPLDKDADDDRWNRMYRRHGKRVTALIKDLRGFWVKVGQYLSSRADVMPRPWVMELASLQDTMPFQPYSDVAKTIREELGRDVSEVFSSFDKVPLAAASIAQVHKAQLRGNRATVVVKVQHRNIESIMRQDLHNLQVIIRWVAWLEPTFDFGPVLDEWSKVAIKELDFTIEAENMRLVRANLRKAKVNAIVPRTYKNLHTRRVIVMEFCEGFKITDEQSLERYGVDRKALLIRICEAYAVQVYRDGFFNCDPHPGNILVQVKNGEAVPVLLDYGMCKRLEPKMRWAFARLVYSASVLDLGSMLVSFEEMGLVLKRMDPVHDMQNIRFVLRDTAPGEESREQTRKFREDRWAKRQSLPPSERNPVEAWPTDLLFFFRVTLLLRGLCSVLNLRIKYTQVLAPYARLALIQSVPRPLHASRILPQPLSGGNSDQENTMSPMASALSAAVTSVLRELYEEKQFNGIQVAVYYKGEKLVDLAAGTLGPADPRPVRPDSLFNCFSVTKAIASVALMQLVDQHVVRLADAVASVWPDFGKNGKKNITVRDVLLHRAGLHRFPGIGVTLADVTEWKTMLQKIAEAKPEDAKRTHYHILSYGWLVGGIVEAATGQPFAKAVRQRLAAPLGIEDEFFIGLNAKDESIAPRLAVLSNAIISGDEANPPSEEEIRQFLKRMRDNQQASEAGDAADADAAVPPPSDSAIDEASAQAVEGGNVEPDLAEEEDSDDDMFPSDPDERVENFYPPLFDVSHEEGVATKVDELFDKLADLARGREAQGWQRIKEKDDVTIWKQPNYQDGGSALMVKGVTRINRPPGCVLRVLAQDDLKSQWNKMWKKQDVLYEYDKFTKILRDEYNPIFPAAGRDFCILQAVRFFGTTSFSVVGISVERDDCPPVKGVVRAEAELSGILVQEDRRDPHACTVTYITCVDLKGSLPTFVTNTVAVGQPLAVAALRRLVQQKYPEGTDYAKQHPQVMLTPSSLKYLRRIHQQRSARPSIGNAEDMGIPELSQAANGDETSEASTESQSGQQTTTATSEPGAQSRKHLKRKSTSSVRFDMSHEEDADVLPSNGQSSSHSTGGATSESSELEGDNDVFKKTEEDAVDDAMDVADLDIGKVMLVDPCIYNSHQMRAACIPSANGHFSARALAKFYAALAQGGELEGERLLKKATVYAMMQEHAKERIAFSPEPLHWGLGVQLYRVTDIDGNETTAFGHLGLGGSSAFCDPHNHLSMAVTVNKLSLSQICATRLADAVYRTLGLGSIKFVSY